MIRIGHSSIAQMGTFTFNERQLWQAVVESTCRGRAWSRTLVRDSVIVRRRPIGNDYISSNDFTIKNMRGN